MPCPLKSSYLRTKWDENPVSFAEWCYEAVDKRPLYLIVFLSTDIYVSLVSNTHQVAAKGWFVAMVSTTVETNDPEREIIPGLKLLEPIRQKWVSFYHIVNQLRSESVS